MRVPERLVPLVEQGVIEAVLRPLMSGKEADVFLVWSDGEERVAKVYKEAQNRSFKHRAAYTEGRKVRNTRQARAMAKRSRFGREEEEAAWRSAEVDAIYRLKAAGVRVPEPYAYIEGVLVMELVTDPDGAPALRLVDAVLSADEAWDLFHECLQQTVMMLCAGIVHGDLSDFNILLGPDGPVIIDFPQAVDPASNNNARKLLVRDVQNLQSFLARYAPNLRRKRYGEEMWALYEANELRPDTKLTGRFAGSNRQADTGSLLEEIEQIEREARARREALGLPPPRRRTAAPRSGPEPKPIGAQRPAQPNRPTPRVDNGSGGTPGPNGESKRKRRRNRGKRRSDAPPAPAVAEVAASPLDDLDALLQIED